MNKKEKIAEQLNGKSKDELIEMLIQYMEAVDNLNAQCEKMNEYIVRNNRIKQLVGIMSVDNISKMLSLTFNKKAVDEIESYYYPEESKEK